MSEEPYCAYQPPAVAEDRDGNLSAAFHKCCAICIVGPASCRFKATVVPVNGKKN